MVEKGEGNDVTFEAFFALLTVVRQNKWHFWKVETKLGKIGRILKQNFTSEI